MGERRIRMGEKFVASAIATLVFAAVAACGSDEPVADPIPTAAVTSSTIHAASPTSVVSASTGASPPVTSATSPASDPDISGLTSCIGLAEVEAPTEWYRDEPVYVENEMPIGAVERWARDKPGYAGIWIDRDHNGWVTVAFTEDVGARQAELVQEFPDDGVVAVDVPYTERELEALHMRVHRRVSVLEEFGTSQADVRTGYVGLFFTFLTQEAVDAISEFADQPVCADGRRPSQRKPDRPQPTEGDGWRLLGDELVGETYRTGIATNEEQYERLWSSVGLQSERPSVDFESEVAIWFGAVYGSDCPIRMYDVIVDGELALVHGRFKVLGYPAGCNDDANSHAFVVAVDRAILPRGPFAIQLDADVPPIGAPEERTLVDVDLSVPGAEATDEQVGEDPQLIEDAKKDNVEHSPAIVEAGYPFLYELDLACGVRTLGIVNDQQWVTDEASGADDFVPEAWRPLVEDGHIEIEIVLRVNPPRILARAAGTTVHYRLATDADTPCTRR